LKGPSYINFSRYASREVDIGGDSDKSPWRKKVGRAYRGHGRSRAAVQHDVIHGRNFQEYMLRSKEDGKGYSGQGDACWELKYVDGEWNW